MTWGWTRALVERREPGCGAGCGGRGDSSLHRGGMFIYRLFNAATVSRTQEAGMAIPPCAAGLCSSFSLLIVLFVGFRVRVFMGAAARKEQTYHLKNGWLDLHSRQTTTKTPSWGGCSVIFTRGVGGGRGAPLRLGPGIWGARCGGEPTGTWAGAASGAQGGAGRLGAWSLALRNFTRQG